MVSLESAGVSDGVSAQRSAGTPSHMREAEFPAGAALEFSRVLEVVSGYAAGPLGTERIRNRRPWADPAAVRSELALLAGLLRWYQQSNSFDVPPVPPLEAILERLRLPGSILDGAELVSLRQTLAAARAVQAELRRIESECSGIPPEFPLPLPDRSVDQRLARSLDDDGEVLDSASPALDRARRAVQEVRERLVRKLETVLRNTASGESGEVTVRNGRYVIPVRRDARNRPDGIVHDESGSGETLFVEPSAAIDLGNQLRSAQLEADREALRVLRDLTDSLRPHGDDLAQAHTSCVALDDLNARARYAWASQAAVPDVLEPGGPLTLLGARHPLLLARGIETVPFDLALTGSERTLVISGPNAGGKTVLLKTVGLAAALVQSGIVPPLGPGSALPVFGRIVADIGDHQSISADLSTFTAHLVVLRDLLEVAGSGTLVLIDEIGSGTDPSEGGALAAAALLFLTRRGCHTVATTHLGSLKALAAQSEGIVNGSLQFDPDRLAPTFRFLKGPPGRSYGLAIARRLGLPDSLLARAEERITGEERSLDALLEAAERRERTLAAAQAELDLRLARAEQESARLDAELTSVRSREAELRERERSAEQRARDAARQLLLEARAEVEAAVRAAQASVSEREATEARRRLEAAILREGEALRGLESGVGTGPGIQPPVVAGQQVRLGTGSTARVMEVRDDGKAVVMSGSIKLVLPLSQLRPGAAGPEKPSSPAGSGLTRPPRTPEPAGDRLPGEVDLRGLRVDEAEAATLSALDAAVLGDLPRLRIIHGMGTGALKEVVRRVLRGDRRVTRFAPAPSNQGGTGVTVAELVP